jgi:hypothetical protein
MGNDDKKKASSAIRKAIIRGDAKGPGATAKPLEVNNPIRWEEKKTTKNEKKLL